MKRSRVLFAVALTAASLFIGRSAFADNSKHISDGAAKGQATEGMAHATKGHHKVKHGKAHHKPGKSHMAVKGSGVPKNTTKNISDGAAKGQASEGTEQPTTKGQPDKVNNKTTTRSNTQHN